MAGPEKLEKSDAARRQPPAPAQYRITHRHGAERAFSGPSRHVEGDGPFRCVCCGAALFRTDTKDESGSGWFAPVSPDAVDEPADRSRLMTRTAVRRATCDAHPGHVFPDGPAPTGRRSCMNGTALAFAEDAG